MFDEVKPTVERVIALTRGTGVAPRWKFSGTGSMTLERGALTLGGDTFQITTLVPFLSGRRGTTVTMICTLAASRPAEIFTLAEGSLLGQQQTLLEVVPSANVQTVSATFTVEDGATTIGVCSVQGPDVLPTSTISLHSLSFQSTQERGFGRGFAIRSAHRAGRAMGHGRGRMGTARGGVGAPNQAPGVGRSTASRRSLKACAGVAKRVESKTDRKLRRHQQERLRAQQQEVLSALQGMRITGSDATAAPVATQG